MKKLLEDFYLQEDVLGVGKKLLGKFLFTKTSKGRITGGMIVETESYKGPSDKASHAYLGKKTKKNGKMYEKGGIAYVYICYGMYNLLNVVTNKKDIPHAVLIRAIEPTEGLDIMLKRRKLKKMQRNLTAGPGVLCQALNITKKQNGLSFASFHLWLEDRDIFINEKDIICSKRVGIDYAKEHADLPWRFRIKGSLWTSIAK